MIARSLTRNWLCRSPPSLSPTHSFSSSFSHFSSSSSSSLIKPTLDLSEPHLWYPKTRTLRRRIICHAGPTNSGKTWASLEALAEAANGIYCGPLRLLAFEVSEKLRKKGVKCDMVTGNEIDISKAGGGTHVACTVEMANLNKFYEVAVLDEAQLIGDANRGWAWTQALLGLQCRDIHVCGSPTMLQIIVEIAKITGDELVIHSHDRLSPLETSKKSLFGSLANIEDGDCLISFDRKSLYKLKRQIENQLKKKCCIIYGSLPPEARREQAKLFNRGNSEEEELSYNVSGFKTKKSKNKSFGSTKEEKEYSLESHLDKEMSKKFNILIATDAIGMGLNLSIRRIVFVTLEKFNGEARKVLSTAEIKQIAGRAGRFQSKYDNGVVTCLNESDVGTLHKLMAAKDVDIKQCGYFMSADMLLLIGLMNDFNMNEEMIKSMALQKDQASQFNSDGFELSEQELAYQVKNLDYQINREMQNQYGEKGGFILNYSWVIKKYYSVRNFISEFLDFIRNSEKHKSIWKRYVKKYRKLQASLRDIESIECELKYSSNRARRNRGGSIGRASSKLPKPFYERSKRQENSSEVDMDDDFHRLNKFLVRSDEGLDGDSRSSTSCSSSGNIDPQYAREEEERECASYEPTLSLAKLIELFSLQSRLDLTNKSNGNTLYFACKLEDFKDISDELEDIPICFADKYQFCCAPVNTGDEIVVDYLRYYAFHFSRIRNLSRVDGKEAEEVSNSNSSSKEIEASLVPLNIDILDIHVLEAPVADSILEMEEIHRAIDLYRWLAVRFPLIFADAANADLQAKHCSSLINVALLTAKLSASDMERHKKDRRDKRLRKYRYM